MNSLGLKVTLCKYLTVILQNANSETTNSDSKRMVGSEKLPANFKLESIVCHKGSSIHTG